MSGAEERLSLMMVEGGRGCIPETATPALKARMVKNFILKVVIRQVSQSKDLKLLKNASTQKEIEQDASARNERQQENNAASYDEDPDTPVCIRG
jgi:hypothetical protein